MSNRNNGEVLFWLGLLALAFIGWQVYVQVKAFADWMHLDWRSAAWLLAGIVALAAGVVVALAQGWQLGRLLPWMLCGFYLFTLPALNYWSLSFPDQLFRDSGYGYGRPDNVAWYGNGWWQLLMFVALVAGAFGINKWQDDRY
jgi:hypothetical protein